MIIIYILIVILFLVLILYNYKKKYEEEEIDETNYDYLLQKYHLSLIKIQNINYNSDEEINIASFYFKYITRISINPDNYSIFNDILSNILNNSNVSITNKYYKAISIPKNICMSVFLLDYTKLNKEVLTEIFLLFIKWNNELKHMFEYKNNEYVYSNALIYIIMYTINEKYSLNIELNTDEYNRNLLIFNTPPLILSCKVLNNTPGFYSDGSYTYNSPLLPGSIIEGSEILDVIIFAKYILFIQVNDDLIQKYFDVVMKELHYYGCFMDTVGYKIESATQSSYITQIIFQLSYIYPEILSYITDSNYLLKNIILDINSIQNTNLFPTLINKLNYLNNEKTRFDIHTVNGTMRVIKNGYGITSSNYSSFCYNDDININNRFLKYSIEISNPYYSNYIISFINARFGILKIQNIFTNNINSSIKGNDHASVGYILNDNELFVAKGYTAQDYRMQSYEILTYNSIVSVNHMTLNYDLIGSLDIIIFIWRNSPIRFFNNFREVHIENYKIYCNYPMKTLRLTEFMIFTITVRDFNDLVVSFSINRPLTDIILRPDESTVCSGIMTIKEKRENKYIQDYVFTPEDFDPLGIHYFEVFIYELKIGFVLYGPFENVATRINDKNVIVNNNGVRYILL
ncbi:hypothetical protein AMV195 [Betaentomopoxvirus amoorei]|uniref:AMV195 n=1 Tax=Amsacta moorei entomopoxvirus TaxID=28321 RepID=Q9EML1_AMEPV|nr:hypothetical protein AMV195 [Amsacta moorei entomopoxvirus]AAG02901.1 AMV195 [Amsacta moorei entomopoxvirus]